MPVRFAILQFHRQLSGFDAIVKCLVPLVDAWAVRSQIIVELRQPPGEVIVALILCLALPQGYNPLANLHQIVPAGVQLVRLGDRF
jgi:hypothetical protein